MSSPENASAQADQQPPKPRGALEALGAVGIDVKMLLSVSDENDELDEKLVAARDKFIEYTFTSGVRYRKFGMLAEIVARTNVLLYDLPELAQVCDTAFADSAGHIFFYAPFWKRLLEERDQGYDSVEYLFAHEADHIRRLHLSRMSSFPHDVANAAQDVVINVRNAETIVAAKLDAQGIQFARSADQFLAAMRKWYERHQGSVVKTGWVSNYVDYMKHRDKSEEEMASELLRARKQRQDKKELSFAKILEAAAQVVDQAEAVLASGLRLNGSPLPPPAPDLSVSPSEMADLSTELVRIAKEKANPKSVSDSEIEAAADLLAKIVQGEPITMVDVSWSSGGWATTGDDHIDTLSPTQRASLAEQALRAAIAPARAASGAPEDAMRLTDLERGPKSGAPSKGGDQDQDQDQGQGQGQGTAQHGWVPKGGDPTAAHGGVDSHVMSADQLKEILERAGVNKGSIERLGLADKGEIKRQEGGCKDQMSKALTAAIESMMDARKVGKIMPGSHCVDAASGELRDMNRRTLGWELFTKKMILECGRGIKYDFMEPSMIFNTHHTDLGFDHASDVPYDGSHVPGRQVKPLIINVIDSSGSVDDGMLRSFTQVTIDAAKARGRSTAPDVLMMFADTVVRGDEQLLTSKNIAQYERLVQFHGRGGTDLLAGIENAFKLVAPRNTKSTVRGRTIDALFYLTDLGDEPPTKAQVLAAAKRQGLKRVPRIIYLATNLSVSKSFEQAVKDYAPVLYYDPLQTKQKLVLNLDADGALDAGRAKIKQG